MTVWTHRRGSGPARRWRSLPGTAVGAALCLALLGCGPTSDPAPRPLDACGPVSAGEVVGQRPAHARGPLASFPNDHAACAALWLPGADAGFVPQGVAVADGIGWVSGFDGRQPPGRRLCRVLRVDLRSGALLDQVEAVTGSVGGRPAISCRHGGGLLLDSHGLWLAETPRLWLLDPDDLSVRRVWALDQPVQGSFAVHDDSGRIGLGRFRAHRPARLDWFDTEEVLATGQLELSTDDVVESVPAPRSAQGAVWASLGSGSPGVWFTTSHTRCGVLVGPGGVRRGFLPGAEGLTAGDDGRLWALSESGALPYQELGGRPLVPMLVRFDTDDFGDWRGPDCTV